MMDLYSNLVGLATTVVGAVLGLWLKSWLERGYRIRKTIHHAVCFSFLGCAEWEYDG